MSVQAGGGLQLNGLRQIIHRFTNSSQRGQNLQTQKGGQERKLAMSNPKAADVSSYTSAHSTLSITPSAD